MYLWRVAGQTSLQRVETVLPLVSAVARITEGDEVVESVWRAAVFDGAAMVDGQAEFGAAAVPAAVAVEPEPELSDVAPVWMLVQVRFFGKGAERVDSGDTVQGAAVFEQGVPAAGSLY